jgi:hypothetical protein
MGRARLRLSCRARLRERRDDLAPRPGASTRGSSPSAGARQCRDLLSLVTGPVGSGLAEPECGHSRTWRNPRVRHLCAPGGRVGRFHRRSIAYAGRAVAAGRRHRVRRVAAIRGLGSRQPRPEDPHQLRRRVRTHLCPRARQMVLDRRVRQTETVGRCLLGARLQDSRDHQHLAVRGVGDQAARPARQALSPAAASHSSRPSIGIS